MQRVHLEVLKDRMVAQKLCLAHLQLGMREMLDNALIMENGESFDAVLSRAEGYTQIGECLRDRNGRSYPLHHVSTVFPPHAFRVREHRLHLAELHAAVDEAAHTAHLPRDIVADYRQLSEQLYSRSKRVHGFREQQPDDRKLFRTCFGFFPQGHVQVIQGPLSLHFRVYALEDYAKAYSGNRNGVQANKVQMEFAGRTGGAALFYRRIPQPVQGAVSLEQNDDKRLFLGERIGVFRHEQDHIFHRSFQVPWMHVSSQFPAKRFLRCSPDNTREYYAALMQDAIDVSRVLRVAPRAKDELLAKFASGDSLVAIRESMFETGSDALYDFADQEYDAIRETGALRAAPRAAGSLVRRRLHEAYAHTLLHALHALRMLDATGLERPFLAELLRIEPLEKWPRLARMVVERL